MKKLMFGKTSFKKPPFPPRFLFEKTFPTCLTLAHLQGALSADTVYMELLQVLVYLPKW